MLQGDVIKPLPNEDFINHIQVHRAMLIDPTVPEEIKTKLIIPHLEETTKMMQAVLTQQLVMSEAMGQMGMPQGQPGQMQGGMGGQPTGQPGAPAEANGVFSQQF